MKPGWLRVLPPSLQARLEGRLNLQKILVNTGWLFGDRILRLGVGLVVGIWVTRHLAAAGSILAVHIWAAVFVFLGVAQSSWDVAEGLMRLSLLPMIGAVVNVGLNLLLLPAYGGLGAAIATVVAYACSACLASALSRKTHAVLRLQLRALFPVHYPVRRVSA